MTQISASASTAATSSVYGGDKTSPASLQAQLQRYQHQLSDCVNCSSAKTPQGKSDIQAISAKIGEVQRRIANPDDGQATQASKVKPSQQSTAASGLQGNTINVYA
jgi:hypothetical protein